MKGRWGRKEADGRVAQSRGGPMSSSSTRAVSQSVVSPSLPLPRPRFAQGSYPLFSFRAATQWSHGAVGAARHTVCFCSSVSLWLSDNIGVLDNCDKTRTAHVWVCVCVCERNAVVSHCERTHSLLNVSVCHSGLPPSEEPQPFESSCTAFYTWKPKHFFFSQLQWKKKEEVPLTVTSR